MNKPNIIFVFTDQQSAGMMSCTGNRFLHTPAMDSLAENGIRFDRAYCTNPVCLPSRFSLLTGRMPSYIGLSCNDWEGRIRDIPKHIFTNGLGHIFKVAGYDAVYGGKVHLPGIVPQDLGFDYLTADERDGLANVCSDYIRNHDNDKPFLMVASFIDPHDICFMAINDHPDGLVSDKQINEMQQKLQIPRDVLVKRIRAMVDEATAELNDAISLKHKYDTDVFYREICPPLPDNHDPQSDEPEAIGILLDQRPFRRNARENYSEERWRLHRWAYCRLTEIADRQIGTLLEALKESGKEEDTVIIFSSDHGDMDSSHKLEHKDALYEESCRIPLIISHKGRIPGGRIDSMHLVSNGLDLIPTLCDYAGIEHPEHDLEGMSLKAIAEGEEPAAWRNTVKIESEFGRGIISGNFKYNMYFEGLRNEQLYDLTENPLEMRNAKYDVDMQEILDEMREAYSSIFKT